jgi:flagellar basal body-associated protein FliL
MTEVAVLLIVLMMLACLLVMGAMTLMMWRGMRHRREDDTQRGHDASPGA